MSFAPITIGPMMPKRPPPSHNFRDHPDRELERHNEIKDTLWHLALGAGIIVLSAVLFLICVGAFGCGR